MSNLGRTLLCITAGLALTFALACKKKDSTPPTPRDQGTLAAATTDADSPFKIALTIAPDHPRMIKPTTFTLHITDTNGNAADSLAVTGHLTMRAMNMGDNQLKFEPKGGGSYEASVKEMDMSGPWTLTVKASGKEVRAQKSFDFVVGE